MVDRKEPDVFYSVNMIFERFLDKVSQMLLFCPPGNPVFSGLPFGALALYPFFWPLKSGWTSGGAGGMASSHLLCIFSRAAPVLPAAFRSRCTVRDCLEIKFPGKSGQALRGNGHPVKDEIGFSTSGDLACRLAMNQ